MENSTETFVNSRKNSLSLSEKLYSTKQFFNRNKQLFLQRYDEVLSKHILNVFHRSTEEYDRPHDHRVTKVIHGELVNLRLDSLNGQADGIKVSSPVAEEHPLYIWFQPDFEKDKIIFKTVCGDSRKKIQMDLQKVGSDFLSNLIQKLFIQKHLGIKA